MILSGRLALRRHTDEPVHPAFRVQKDQRHPGDIESRLAITDFFDRVEVARALAIPVAIRAGPFGAHRVPARRRLIVLGNVTEIVFFKYDAVGAVQRLLAVAKFVDDVPRMGAQNFG